MSFIEFSNFRCYPSARFNLPDGGLNLLSGKSGAGKTTILEGVSYALYGKPLKPYTFGKNTCTVKLHLESHGITVVRTARPNRLLVTCSDKQYEDRTAQKFIDRTMASYEKFEIGSYIRQKTNNSIVSMTPTQQLEFIHSIAIDDDVTGLKTKLKSTTSEQDAVLNRLKGETGAVEKMLDDYKHCAKCEDPLTIPLDEAIARLETLARDVTKSRHRLTRVSEEIDEVKDEMVLAHEREKAVQTLKKLKKPDDQETYKKTLERYEVKGRIDEVKAQYESVVYHINATEEFIEKNLERMNSIVVEDTVEARKANEAYKLRNLLLEELEGLDVEEVEDPREELRTEREQAADHTRAVREYTEHARRFDEVVERVREVTGNKLTNPTSAKVAIAIKRFVAKNTQVFACPSCSCHIMFANGEYVATTEKLTSKSISKEENEELVRLKHEAIDFHKRLSPPKDRVSRMAELENRLRLWEENERIIKRRNTLEERIAKLDVDDVLYEKNEKLIKTAAENQALLSTLVNQLEDADEKLEVLESKKKKLEKEMGKCVGDLPFSTVDEYVANHREASNVYNELFELVQETDDVRSSSVLSATIEELKAEHSVLSTMITDLEHEHRELSEQRLVHIQSYLPYKKRKSLEETLANLKHELALASRKLKNLSVLKEKCKQAEYYAIEWAVDAINVQSKFYLDKMFGDNSIEVTLATSKETGKGSKAQEKQQMNMKLFYKNNAYDSINQLSGGEKDRVNLAFILAVNDVIGNNVLFLDECLASLDAETNSDIFLFLKQYCSDKTILVISHEAVTGIFDTIIDV